MNRALRPRGVLTLPDGHWLRADESAVAAMNRALRFGFGLTTLCQSDTPEDSVRQNGLGEH